ncbi:hypothetical protein H0W26_03610 [Candidatus Dependentiae bacterium]|nr:hypothetical protein [Candidatus Dependentiae bacterium]
MYALKLFAKFILTNFRNPLIVYLTLFTSTYMSVFQVNYAFASETQFDQKIKLFRRLGAQEQKNKVLTELKTVEESLRCIISEQLSELSIKGELSLIDSELEYVEQQFARIERIFNYIGSLSAREVDQLKSALQQERTVREELAQLTCKLLTLELLIPHDQEQWIQATVGMRNKVKLEVNNSLEEIKGLQVQLEEWQLSLQEAREAYDLFRGLEKRSENIPSAKCYLKRILNPATEEILPEILRADINHYGLNSSLFEEMENSTWQMLRAVGKIGQSLSHIAQNSTAQKLFLSLLAPKTMAATISNNGKSYTCVANTSLPLAPFMQIINATGTLSFIIENPSYGNLTGTDTCTGVTALSAPFVINSFTTIDALNITGPVASINTCLNQLVFNPYPNITTTVQDSIYALIPQIIGPLGSSLSAESYITILVPPQVGPCDLGTFANGAQVLFTLAKCPLPDLQMVVDWQATNGFFAKTNSPQVPLSNFTATDMNNNLIIFNHLGNNQAPNLQIEGCLPQICSKFINVTSTFIPTTLAPTARPTTLAPTPSPTASPTGNATDAPTISGSGGMTAGIAGAVVGAAGGIFLISVPIAIRYVNVLSRENYPIANFLYDHYELDTSNFWSGNGQTFKDVIQKIVNRLNISIDILTIEDLKEKFCTKCLIPAIDENVAFQANGLMYGYIFGKNTLDLEVFRNEQIIDNIVKAAQKIKRVQMPELEEQIADQVWVLMGQHELNDGSDFYVDIDFVGSMPGVLMGQYELNDGSHFSETDNGFIFDNAIKGIFLLLTSRNDFYMPGNTNTQREFIQKCLLPAFQELKRSLPDNDFFIALQEQSTIDKLALSVYSLFQNMTYDPQQSSDSTLLHGADGMIPLDVIVHQYVDVADLKNREPIFSNKHRMGNNNVKQTMQKRDHDGVEHI